MTQDLMRKGAVRLAQKTAGTLVRNWLRKRLFLLAKLPILALGLAAVFMTTNALDTVKTIWTAGHVAAAAVKQASQIKQPQQVEK